MLESWSIHDGGALLLLVNISIIALEQSFSRSDRTTSAKCNGLQRIMRTTKQSKHIKRQ
ncbi:hypothetical protein [Nodularia chucula]|uniref:hypothetical protein n=1 Tax=Nodularia chucula TaxID=3093667 RepID=UPI0039C6E9F5